MHASLENYIFCIFYFEFSMSLKTMSFLSWGVNSLTRASPSSSPSPSEEPHQHLEKFHMVCDLVNLPQVTPEIIKMKLFPHTLRDKASHWLSTLDRELTSWKDIEQAFLRKFYPLGKTQNMRKHIWSFSQRPGETLHQTWEKFKDLLRKCPHHAIPKWQLNRIFYDGLLEQHRNMVDSICGGAFMEKTPDEIYSLYENLKNRFQKNQPSQTQPDAMEMMQQMSQMMQQTMNQMMQQTMNQMMLHQKQIIEALGNKREEGQLPSQPIENSENCPTVRFQQEELRNVKDLPDPYELNFIIVYMKMTENINHAPIILGRPFLETVKAIIDRGKRIVELKFG
ncbi:unnamed protein product [Spirodela intermedia]|uniref:Retrotransposon gag domain-containing protein n=1 Tax=Spirodela intermedia TaxID=51605 RepID=A0A7I8LG41_SPIIN|nr:unnamed protein product [Spirodela intermedia]